MDLFEFIAGMISVILALVLAQIFMGLAHLAQTRARVRYSLLHASWVLTLLLITFQHWWSIWDFRELEWTFPMVLYSMLCPSILFFSATLVSPHNSDDDEIDLEAYFHHVSGPFLMAFIVGSVLGSADGVLFGTEPLFNRLRMQLLAVTGGAAVVLMSDRRTLQLAGTLVVLIATLTGIAIRFLPGVIA